MNRCRKISGSNTPFKIGIQSERQVVDCAWVRITPGGDKDDVIGSLFLPKMYFLLLCFRKVEGSQAMISHFIFFTPEYGILHPTMWALIFILISHNVLSTEWWNTRLPLNGTFCGWPFEIKWWLILFPVCSLSPSACAHGLHMPWDSFHFAQMSAFWIYAETISI